MLRKYSSSILSSWYIILLIVRRWRIQTRDHAQWKLTDSSSPSQAWHFSDPISSFKGYFFCPKVVRRIKFHEGGEEIFTYSTSPPGVSEWKFFPINCLMLLRRFQSRKVPPSTTRLDRYNRLEYKTSLVDNLCWLTSPIDFPPFFTPW